MSLNSALTPVRDKHQTLSASRHRLFHRILDQRLVHHREHLLWHRFGSRQKTGTTTSNRKNGCTNCFTHLILIELIQEPASYRLFSAQLLHRDKST